MAQSWALRRGREEVCFPCSESSICRCSFDAGGESWTPRVSRRSAHGTGAFPLLPGASGAGVWRFVSAETLARVRELLQGDAVCSSVVLQA